MTDTPEARLHAMADLLTPWAIRVAATIGLADAVVDGADTVPAAATATDTEPRALAALVGHLAAKGLFEVTDGRMELTAIGSLLTDGPGWRDHLDLSQASSHMGTAYAGLLHSVRTGEAGYPEVYGSTLWERFAADPGLGASFDEHLGHWAQRWSPPVVASDVWSHARHVVDVGGDTGVLIEALAAEHDHLTFTLVELAETVERASSRLAPLGDRVTFNEASFFDPLPAGDTYVLAQVLHDWPDEEAVRILRRCAEAVPDDGQVILVERLPGDDADHTEMSLFMLALFGASERSLDEYSELCAAAGLRIDREQPRGDGPLSVLRARPDR